MQLRFGFLGFFVATCAFASATEQERFIAGIGPHHRHVSTKSPIAQRYFDQGLSLLYGFNHDEAARSFRAATVADPTCAMAWWGLALTNGPHINNPSVSPAQAKAAIASLRHASSLISRASPVERSLIRSAMLRYRDPQPADRRPLDKAFAQAMRETWRRYPKDADVGALYAESMMDLRPWDLWLHDGRPQPGTLEITATLAKVLQLNPRHPQALHLTIHAWEASPTPQRSEVAANRLRNLMPGLGHMVHMPSHTDVRLGMWTKAIVSNERAIQVDNAYRKRRPRQGFYRIYMAHNRHMLGFSAMMTGQSAKSLKALDSMTSTIPPEFIREAAPIVDGFVVMPLEGRVRFGRWDEVLAAPDYPEYLPLSRALRRAARGVAYAAKGMVPEAEIEQARFIEARDKVPKGYTFGNNKASQILLVAQHMLHGEIALAKGESNTAIASLRQAVAAEDAMAYDEPPDWIIPTRHTLGVALLDAGRLKEAEAVYREDLKRLPNNGWALYGLSQALDRQKRPNEAVRAQRLYQTVWRNADLKIGSSCMCVPNPK